MRLNSYRDGRPPILLYAADRMTARRRRPLTRRIVIPCFANASAILGRSWLNPVCASCERVQQAIMACNAFERIAATLDCPMVIVTTRAEDKMDGCLVGFSTQCSIDPSRYLVCLSRNNRTYELAQRASTLAVHMLHDDKHDRALARLFGEHTARDVDKLADCEWEPGPDGVPVLRSCDWFGGPILRRTDLGDHVGFTIDVQYGRAVRIGEPCLTFSDVTDLTAGNPA
jgi:flavin reductase (DIM6/NTAB) family NADH-FMN oxidoreductase RutF